MLFALGACVASFSNSLGILSTREQLGRSVVKLAERIARAGKQNHRQDKTAKIEQTEWCYQETQMNASGQVNENDRHQHVSGELIVLVMDFVEHVVRGDAISELREIPSWSLDAGPVVDGIDDNPADG